MRENNTDLRLLALETLLEIERTGGKAGEIIRAVLEKYRFLPKNQRAFYARLTEGVIENRICLDYVIGCYSRTPVNKIKPVLRNILRMAVYQIREMDAVPDAAAVSEAVELAGKKGFGPLKGYVNGVLRSMIREPQKADLPPETDACFRISVLYSMPEFLVRQWLNRFGEAETERICRAFLEPRKTTVRIRGVDPAKCIADLTREGVRVEKAPLAEDAYYLSDYDVIPALEAFRQGWIIVQDLSSMLAVRQAGLSKDRDVRILDVCAAPGGKSLLAADLAGPGSGILARDISEAKTVRIEENIRRCRLENIETGVWDARVYDPALENAFDLVIADVPCSGYGVIGRKPDIKHRASAENQHALAQIQREILETVSKYVRPGGKLLYSTCTISAEENEENVAWFLEKGGYALAPEGMRQLLPGKDPCDGFFTALMERKERTAFH